MLENDEMCVGPTNPLLLTTIGNNRKPLGTAADLSYQGSTDNSHMRDKDASQVLGWARTINKLITCTLNQTLRLLGKRP